MRAGDEGVDGLGDDDDALGFLDERDHVGDVLSGAAGAVLEDDGALVAPCPQVRGEQLRLAAVTADRSPTNDDRLLSVEATSERRACRRCASPATKTARTPNAAAWALRTMVLVNLTGLLRRSCA